MFFNESGGRKWELSQVLKELQYQQENLIKDRETIK